MPKVKICGLTNIDDAVVAARAGADYLGFIFYPPSPRTTNEADVTAMVQTLRAETHCPQLVGVFVNETAAEMARLMNSCGLDLAQLSGDETPNLIGDPNSPIYGRSYKALKPATVEEAEADVEWFAAPEPAGLCPAILIDTYHPTLPGGTGKITDWEMASTLAEKLPKLMLAGGLTPDNVAAAVARVHPYAIDVASGVEAAKGKKDHDKVRSFITQAHMP